MDHKRLTLFAGHYGSGKTNIAVNYALGLAGEGKAVVLVLHDLPLALTVADSLAVLWEGRCLCQGDPDTVFQSGHLKAAFGVEIHRIHTEAGWKYYY